MYIKENELKEGDMLRSSQTGEMITIVGFKLLVNGKTQLKYSYRDKQRHIQTKDVYLEIVELMGFKKIESES
jgi:hypothetical protein